MKTYKTLIAAFCALVATAATAQTFSDGTLNYSVEKNTTNVSVTGLAVSSAENLVIPQTVSNEGTTYTVTQIANQAFNYNSTNNKTTLTGTLKLPSTITYIGVSAFDTQKGLTGQLILPDGITSIGSRAFYDCTGFEGDFTLPSRISSIGWGAFNNCSGLTGSLVIPETLTSLNTSTFSGCSGFTGTLTLPSTLTSLAYSVFQGCSGFTGDLIIPATVTKIEGSGNFQNCSGIENIYMFANVTDIPASTFYGCSNAKSVYLWSGVKSVGGNAFFNCTSLESVYCPAVTPPKAEETITSSSGAVSTQHIFPQTIYGTCKLYVPEESISYYEEVNDNVWYKFLTGNIVAQPDIYLTVIYPDDNATLKLPLVFGDLGFQFSLLPYNGWSINSVTHTINDVTTKLSASDVSTYAAANAQTYSYSGGNTADQTITLSMTQDTTQGPTTGADGIQAGDIAKVYVLGNTLYVEGADAGLVSVYNTAGQHVVTTPEKAVKLPAPGIYVVTVGNRNYKVIAR